jgi:type II secretory pathway pseudopilin PulG
MQILLVVTTVLALLATLLAFLALRANRTLRRALMALAEATGQATPEFRRRWRPCWERLVPNSCEPNDSTR